MAEFERARSNGKKYINAIDSGVEAVKSELGCRMSPREAKRIFKEFGFTKENKKETLRCKKEIEIEGKKDWSVSLGKVPTFKKLKSKPFQQKFSKGFTEKA